MSQDDSSPPENKRRIRRPAKPQNTATNLLIADILVRGASRLWRKRVDEKVAKAAPPATSDEKPAVDGRTMLTTLGLYGASKLANKSASGLALVASGLVAKTLYDRGKARQKRLAHDDSEQSSDKDGE